MESKKGKMGLTISFWFVRQYSITPALHYSDGITHWASTYWSDGNMKKWSNGKLKKWSNGVLE
jgi:hypothetical protein